MPMAHSLTLRARENCNIARIYRSIYLSIRGGCERGKQGSEREGGRGEFGHRSIIWVFHSLSPPQRKRKGKEAANAGRPSKKRIERKEDRKCAAPAFPSAGRCQNARGEEEITEMAVVAAADTNCGKAGNVLHNKPGV